MCSIKGGWAVQKKWSTKLSYTLQCAAMHSSFLVHNTLWTTCVDSIKREMAERSGQRSRVRHSIVVNFDSQSSGLAFKSRLDNGLMSAIFDLVERFASVFPGSS